MNTETNFMNFEDLTKLIEEHKKETHPYKSYNFDSTSYTLLLIDINNLIKENRELKKLLEEYETYLNRFFKINNKSYDGKIVLGLLDKKEAQQKKFIKWLEYELNTSYKNSSRYYHCSTVLQKYRSIIGVSNENN